MSTIITPTQLRNNADDLKIAATHIFKFLSKNAESISQADRLSLIGASQDLLEKSIEVRQQATAIDLGKTANDLPIVLSATNEAKKAIRNISRVKNAVKVATELVAFATSISSGNAKDIIKSAKKVYKTAKGFNES